MFLYTNKDYLEDIDCITRKRLPWEKLADTRLLISGATGLLGSYLVDLIMTLNKKKGLNCTVYILGRSEQKAAVRFSKWQEDDHLAFIKYDVKEPLRGNELGSVDYVLHLASNTHPLLYSTDPIGTIMTNIIGLQNLLEFSYEHDTRRVAFASSNEIYGENRGDVELFTEKYCGYIDSNTLRACYTESKRCGEALCQAYISQKKMDIVIPRFTRSYGPTMQMTDSKAISQFIKKGVAGEDIVLKSAGTQKFSYTYMADAVYGLMTILFNGKCGEAYNIADEASNITLKDLAKLIANYVGKKVVFEIPDSTEAAGYSKATKALLDGSKIKEIGWDPVYTVHDAIPRTIDILRQ